MGGEKGLINVIMLPLVKDNDHMNRYSTIKYMPPLNTVEVHSLIYAITIKCKGHDGERYKIRKRCACNGSLSTKAVEVSKIH